MSPPTIQAARTRMAVPTARAMSLVTRKMPVPMVSLITMAVADHRPRPRIKTDPSSRFVRLGFVTFTKVDTAYYRGLRWSINLACYFYSNADSVVLSRDYALSSRQNDCTKVHAQRIQLGQVLQNFLCG